MRKTGDKHINNNVEKRDYRCHVANVGLNEFPNGMPKNGLYISLTGTMAEGTRRKKWGEIDYGCKLGLYKASNIVSVDSNAEVCVANRRMCKRGDNANIKIFEGDIKDAVLNAAKENKVISMVNLDFMTTPETEFERVAAIAEAVQGQKEKCVMVLNFVTQVPFQSANPDVLGRMHESVRLSRIFRNHAIWTGWAKSVYDPFHTRTSRLPMTSIVLVKNEGVWADKQTFVPSPNIINRKAVYTGVIGRPEIWTKELLFDYAKQVKSGMKLKVVCEKNGVSYGSVFSAMKRHGMTTKIKKCKATIDALKSGRPEQGKAAFFNLERCLQIKNIVEGGGWGAMSKLCQENGWRRSSVERAMNRNGVVAYVPSKKYTLAQCKQVSKLAKHKSLMEVCRKMNLPYNGIRSALAKYGLKK